MITVGLGESFLVRGQSLPQLVNFTSESGIVPSHWSQIGQENPFLDAFGISLSFDRENQELTVRHKSGNQVRFQHEGLRNDFDWCVTYAVICLAVLPDKLWEGVQAKGLLIGRLTSDYFENTWAGSGSLFLNETGGQAITYKRSSDALIPMSVSELARYLELFPKLQQRREKMRPVGVFADLRTAKI